MTQRQPYELIRHYPNFELRLYPAGIQIETTQRGGFLEAGYRGFGPLVRFISGANQENRKIAMTAPVIQEPRSESEHRVRFVLPEGFDLANSPIPLDGSVSVIEVPKHLAAAKRFGGSWSEDKFNQEGKDLIQAVLTERLTPMGNLYFARYNPPWVPGFIKRNEVLIALKGDSNV